MRVLVAWSSAASFAVATGCTVPRDVVSSPPPTPEVVAVEAGGEFASAVPLAVAGGPVDAAKTLDYWNRVREIFERRRSKDLKVLIGEYGRAVEEIRALPAVGVDGELLAHAENVARRLEGFASLGSLGLEHPAEVRRINGIERTVLNSGMAVEDATSQLKGLRAKLSQRHGMEFPAIIEPK